MILNAERKIAYVHIPKCAGSMVKSQLAPLKTMGERYESILPHADYGKVHTAHLPLWLVQEMYPEDLETLTQCAAYTIVRDPYQRFQSALAQRIEQFRDVDPFALSADEITGEVEEVIAFLKDNPSNPTLEFVHFLRQHDFVYLEGQQVVEHVYRLDAVESMLRAMEPATGLTFTYSLKANQKMNFRLKALRGPAYALNTVVKKLLPTAIYSPLKDAASSMLVKSPDTLKDTILSAPGCCDFIKDHYRQDFELFEGALQ